MSEQNPEDDVPAVPESPDDDWRNTEVDLQWLFGDFSRLVIADKLDLPSGGTAHVSGLVAYWRSRIQETREEDG